MSDHRTTHIKLSWAESKVTYEGGIELTVCGHTEGGKTHNIIVHMGPSSIGYIADELHSALTKCREVIDTAARRLKGE